MHENKPLRNNRRWKIDQTNKFFFKDCLVWGHLLILLINAFPFYISSLLIYHILGILKSSFHTQPFTLFSGCHCFNIVIVTENLRKFQFKSLSLKKSKVYPNPKISGRSEAILHKVGPILIIYFSHLMHLRTWKECIMFILPLNIMGLLFPLILSSSTW